MPRLSILAAAFIAMVLAAAPSLAGDLPDRALTPGAVLTTDAAAVCTPGYAKSVRHVSGKVKAAVYREYGIAHHASGEYEVDHLISLELGGSNDIGNLWPPSYRTEPWNAHVKDKLEDRLHALVCAGKMSLPDAQKAIAGDWISAYKRWVANGRPLMSRRPGNNHRGVRYPKHLAAMPARPLTAFEILRISRAGVDDRLRDA